MGERHTVYITREVEIEVEVDLTRGRAATWWEPADPAEGYVVESSERLTEQEQEEAVDKAMHKPPPMPDPWPESNPIEKPF